MGQRVEIAVHQNMFSAGFFFPAKILALTHNFRTENWKIYAIVANSLDLL